jgi:hypothetical protein
MFRGIRAAYVLRFRQGSAGFDSRAEFHSPDGNSYADGGEICSLPAFPGWNIGAENGAE